MGSLSEKTHFLGDAASRGSQADPQGAETHQVLIPQAECAMKTNTVEFRKRPWPRPHPTKSLLLGKDTTFPPILSGVPKKRKTAPHSNWAYNPAPTEPVPTEFDLGGFAFTYLPDPHHDYDRFNNDLTIERYLPSARSYSGAQRKGIAGPFPNADSYLDHIQEALQAPFPLAEHTPLPADLITALKFNRGNSRETVRGFQNSQIKQLRIIAQECQEDTERWYRFVPEELKQATGPIHIALLAHLTRFTRMKGANWIMQFVTGFPITGTLSQDGVFPRSATVGGELLDAENLNATKTARFRARAPRANSRPTQDLRGEAISQVSKGWLEAPLPLEDNGNIRDSSGEKINIAFRIGVSQTDKLMGCDDFKDALTNKRCRVSAPITLPGWDHIASAARILSLPNLWLGHLEKSTMRPPIKRYRSDPRILDTL